MSLLSATVKTTVHANLTSTFEHIVPIDLTSIFTGYGPLPAVVSIQKQLGDWNTVGETRTVYLSDHSSVQEQLTTYEYPSYFSYTVSQFTSSLRFLIHSAEGEWWFSPTPSAGTDIQWRYTFIARSPLAYPLLWIIAKFLWRNYMNQVLQRSKIQIDQSR